MKDLGILSSIQSFQPLKIQLLQNIHKKNNSSEDSVNNTDKPEDNDLKNLTEPKDDEKTDYKKMSEDLKSEIDKLKSDLTSIQAENTGKNIEHNMDILWNFLYL